MAPEWKKQAKAVARAQNAAKRSGKKKPPLTHFLCLPLGTAASRPVLEKAVGRLKEAVEVPGLVPDEGAAVVASAVRPVGTLHLTLGVMSLTGEGKVEEAVGFLRELDFGEMLGSPVGELDKDVDSVEGGGDSVREPAPGALPLVVTLDGLHAMRSPSSTSSLYMAPRDTTQRLLRFCDSLKSKFLEKELMVDENRPLTLHVTVINTIYAKRGGGRGNAAEDRVDGKPKGQEGEAKFSDGDEGEDGDLEDHKGERMHEGNADAKSRNVDDRRGWKRRKPRPALFDARPILERFKDCEWAKDIRLDRVAICKMGAQKILDGSGKVVDEAYEEVAIRELPN